MIMVLIPNGPHLTDTVQCFFFLYMKKKIGRFCFSLVGEVMVFISIFALTFYHNQPVFKQQALCHGLSHSMTYPHKCILYRAKTTHRCTQNGQDSLHLA